MLSERQVYLCVYYQTFLPIWTSVLLGVPLPAQLRFADEVGTPARLVPQVIVQVTWGHIQTFIDLSSTYNLPLQFP